ncbi:MAG TPA: hypothetical protein PKV98_13500 [Burkholderiaceae bacterium]|nr:hypothetical protein [Burkholderiaceae bacterium]
MIGAFVCDIWAIPWRFDPQAAFEAGLRPFSVVGKPELCIAPIVSCDEGGDDE